MKKIVLGVISAIVALFLLLNWYEEPIIFTSSEDQFTVKVLETNSTPNHLSQRFEIRIAGPMTAGIHLANLKEVGFSEVKGSQGKLVIENNPWKVGGFVDITPRGKHSVCEVDYELNTTNGTDWSSQIKFKKSLFSGKGIKGKTTLSGSRKIENFVTSWPGTYSRGTSLVIGDVGEYKILLTVR